MNVSHMADTRPIVAIDIGGTHTRVALFDESERSPIWAPLATFHTAPDYDEQLERLCATLTHTPAHRGIGVSLGGRISRDGASVAVAPNLPVYVGRPFTRDLAARCGGPVRLAHDPVCGVLAERRFGSLQGADRCAYLTVSTGTGAAIHLRADQRMGAPNEGMTLSIEMGHQLLDGNTLPCRCEQIGCLETRTGGRQLTERHGRALTEINDPAVWDEVARKLALGLVNLAQLTRVEDVAVSGAIALQRPGMLDAIGREVTRMLRGAPLHLHRAALGEHAPLVGAALLLSTDEASILH